jgi:putative ABC transport system permease protein
MTIVAHTAGDARALFAPMRAAVRALDPELPLFEVRTMRDAVDRSLTLRRAMALALGTFAAIALTLGPRSSGQASPPGRARA